jgi:3-carboxy-cis,cis-muconate cycloisomerase
MTTNRGLLFGGLFGHGQYDVGDVAWLQAMLDAEAGLARALERAGLAPAGAGEAVTRAARVDDFDVEAIGAQAAAAGNPVPALVRALTGRVPEFAASAVHYGATSQDIIDTAVMLLARGVLEQLEADLAASASAAAGLAAAHARTVLAGRTLLQQAVPVTFGLVAAGWLTALDDARRQLERLAGHRLAVQLGGAAGTLSVLGEAGPQVVTFFAEELGLAAPVLAWHTDRLRVIELAAALAGCCAAVGKIARDVTLLAQSEIAEIREGVAPGRSGAGRGTAETGGPHGGSSAMPHKRNPVGAVLVLGSAKRAPMLLASLAAAAEQELQRAAGAWHAEWEPLSDLLRITGSAAALMAELLAGLEIDADRMRANLAAAHSLPMAEHVATTLIPSLGRLPALDLVAEASLEAARSGQDLTAVLLGTPRFAEPLAAAGVGADELAAAADPRASLGAAEQFVAAALAAHRIGRTGSERAGPDPAGPDPAGPERARAGS